MKDKPTHFLEQWGCTDSKGNTEPSGRISTTDILEIDYLDGQIENTKELGVKTICVFLIYPKKQN